MQQFPASSAEGHERAHQEKKSAKRYQWKLKHRELTLGDRTLIMGVLNVTPDSFSDGGKYSEPDRAFARALELEDEGADIIDIGAESTRPGSARVPEAEELRRLIPRIPARSNSCGQAHSRRRPALIQMSHSKRSDRRTATAR